MVKVSLIVPVYNVEKYLDRCLDSCINQSYQDIEIICVNDGSTDRSPAILEQYQKLDNRIKIINKANGGLSSARNRGLEIAQGKYTLFVDSDDFISSIAVEKLVNNAEENSSDIVIFSYIYVDNYNLTKISVDLNAIKHLPVFNIDIIDGEYYRELPINAWSKLYKTEFLKSNNITFDEGLIYEDVSYWAKVFVCAKRISYLDEPLYSYTNNRAGNIMGDTGKKLFDIFEIHNITKSVLQNSGYYEKYQKSYDVNMITDFIWKFEKIKPEYKESFFNRIKTYDVEVSEEDDNIEYIKHAMKVYNKIKQVSNYQEFLAAESGVKHAE